MSLQEQRRRIINELHVRPCTDLYDKHTRDFLLRYFTEQEDIGTTYLYYPIALSGQQITFARGRLFGYSGAVLQSLLMESDIVGMLYFYGSFTRSMQLSASEKLRVNIFVKPPEGNIDLPDTGQISIADMEQGLPLQGLERICSTYLKAQ